MVYLVEQSNINQQLYPFSFEWDSLVRKHYNKYQQLIDAQTYQLQRIKRYFFKLAYPLTYDSDLVTLHLLQKKQQVGEVTKHEIDMYEGVNPCVRDYFNRTFNASFNFPKFGFGVGGALFLFASVSNFSVPSRLVLFTVPVLLDALQRSRDTKSEIKTTQFLDWVISYRRARSFNERNRDLFNREQTKKAIGDNNLVQLGKSLVRLAQEKS